MDAFAILSPLFASISAMLLLGALLSFSYGVAARLFPTAPGYVRLCGTWVLSYWGMHSLFALLGSLGLFRLPAVLAVLLLAWLVYARWIPVAPMLRQLGADLSRLRSQLSELWVGSGLWMAVAVAIVLVVRLIRGLAAPPLGWDALTYHLFKAGQWVQTGFFVSEAGPDALRAYAYMPPGGQIVWAWAMLPFQGDFPLGPAALLVWLSIFSASFGLSRTLGADARASFATALALGATPAVMTYLTSGYVDNISIALVLLGFLFLARSLRELTVADSAMAIAAFSSGLCVKITTAPILLLAAFAISWSAFRTSRPWTLRGRICAVCLIMGASFVPFYARTWIETGSPVFPWDLIVGGRTIFEGMEMVRTTAAGGMTPGLDFSTARFLRILFVAPAYPGWPFMNLGLASAALLALGAGGAVIASRSRSSRFVTLIAVLFAAFVLTSLMSPSMLAMRTHWAPVVGRLLLSGLAPLVALGAVVPGSVPRAIRVIAVFAALAQSIPTGWGEADLRYGMLAASVVLWAMLLAWAVLRVSRRAIGVRTAVVLAGVVFLFGSIPMDQLRSAARYRIYEEAARDFRRVYDPHPLGPWRDGWPIWMELDDADSHRIALVAGWSKLGDNWFRYPLLGSRLQNEVFYVTPTKDGTLPDYRFARKLGPRLDEKSWLRRLVDAEVDYVVSLAPPPPELVWMSRNPQLFVPVRTGRNGRGAAFRFDRDAAIALLADPAP